MTSVRRRKAVVIDDSLTARMVTKGILEGEGIEVHLACDAVEGARIAREVLPDVIVLDVVLPSDDGILVCQRWRRDPDLSLIPVLLMSGERSGRDDRAAGLSAGALGYVVKPFNRSEMLAQVHLLCELKQTHEALRERAVAAHAASETKSRFLATMSHEIRTPLTAIIGFAEAILDPTSSDAQRNEAARIILRNGHHLLHVVNDILDLSKIEAGKLEVARHHCAPIDILLDVLHLMKLKAIDRRVPLQEQIVYPIPSTVVTDALRLKQVLVNLIDNAIKFASGKEVTVSMECHVAARTLTVKVRDRGVGMTQDQVSRLFQPFSQAEASTAQTYGGTGLGLMISRQLAVMLGGTLELVSAPGEGSCFSLTIDTGDLTSVPLLHQEPELTSSHEVVVEEVGADRKFEGEVLVIDDTDDVRGLITHYLRRSGLRVTETGDGAEGIRVALERRFDLILTDIQMPIVDGYAVISELRAEGYRQPIVALTGNVMDFEVEKLRQLGCDEHLGKPFTRRALMALLERYVGAPWSGTLGGEDDPEERELAIRYLHGLPSRISSLRDHLSKEEWEMLRDEAHRLIGAGLFGLEQISHLARALEGAALQRDRDASRFLVGRISELAKAIERSGVAVSKR